MVDFRSSHVLKNGVIKDIKVINPKVPWTIIPNLTKIDENKFKLNSIKLNLRSHS